VANDLGEFIRAQRRLARLSLRQLAELSEVSNAYLSQVERGLYQPSAHVLKNIAAALHLSAESLYAQAGLLDPEAAPPRSSVEEAIQLDERLSEEQKQALIGVYRGFVS
jgi:transcriptional regulator with XRE-family HTH domain